MPSSVKRDPRIDQLVDDISQQVHRYHKYRKEYGSGVLLTFAWVRNGEAYTHTHRIQRPMPDKRIILKDAPTERVVSYLQNHQNQ